MSQGVTVWPIEEGGTIAYGASRTQWWHARATSAAGTAGNNYFPRWGINNPLTIATTGGGFGGTTGAQWNATEGHYIRRASTGGGFLGLLVNTEAAKVAGAFNLPSGVPGPSGQEVWVLREEIRFAGGLGAGAESVGHGIFCGGNTDLNLGPGGNWLNGAPFRGFLLCRLSSGAFVLAYKLQGSAAIQIPLPGVDLATQYGLVEHRLYMPKAPEVGRYELWLNSARVVTLQGNAAGFPLPLALTHSYMAILATKDNFDGGNAGIHQRYGEIFVGPDTASTFG